MVWEECVGYTKTLRKCRTFRAGEEEYASPKLRNSPPLRDVETKIRTATFLLLFCGRLIGFLGQWDGSLARLLYTELPPKKNA
jgi:hypothetical protein